MAENIKCRLCDSIIEGSHKLGFRLNYIGYFYPFVKEISPNYLKKGAYDSRPFDGALFDTFMSPCSEIHSNSSNSSVE
jgi:hypothetical protein